MAPSIETLFAARLVQALGGSMLNPVAMSIITQMFTGRVERARALGVWGAVVGISMALGPIVGGAAHRVRRLAVGVLDQPADLRRGHPADRDLRAGVQIGDDARRRPDRAGPRHGVPVRHRVRAHRGPGFGWADPRVIVVAVIAAVALPCSCATRRGVTTRSSTSGSSAASRSHPRRSSRYARSPPGGRSCS